MGWGIEFWLAINRLTITFAAIVAIALVLFAWFFMRPSSQPLSSTLEQGIVISAGSLPELGFCPDPNQNAVVRQSDGRVINAAVASAKTLQPGSVVKIRQWPTACNPGGYEVVLRK